MVGGGRVVTSPLTPLQRGGEFVHIANHIGYRSPLLWRGVRGEVFIKYFEVNFLDFTDGIIAIPLSRAVKIFPLFGVVPNGQVITVF